MVAPESRHVTIAPSLSGRVREEVAATQEAGAHWLHLDVMIEHLVSNINFGSNVLAAGGDTRMYPSPGHAQPSRGGG